MENVDKPVKCLGMSAVKAGNHIHASDDIDCFVSQIDCLCQSQFMTHFLMILNYLQSAVACQIGQLLEPYSLSSVEIRSSTCSVNTDCGKLP